MTGAIAIAAGGTGGHFFPAEALASALLARGRSVMLLTDRRSGGERSAVFAGSPVHVLRGAGIAGRGVARAARAAASLGAGTLQARTLLKETRPAALVAFGGYPAVAPVLGTRLMRRRPPVILHEQNAVLGRANRRLCRHADLLALSFADTARVPGNAATRHTGNPVRPDIERRAGSAYVPPSARSAVELLVLGGSLGARVLSQVVPAALALLDPALRCRLRVTQQCRTEDLPAVRAAYDTAGITARLESFFTDVAPLLQAAHLVVARAGASTVAELTLIGRPAVLVPLPHAIDDHQAANAAALGEGAWLMREGVFGPEPLAALLGQLAAQTTLLTAAAARMASLGRRHSAERLADLVDRATEEARA